VLLTIHYQLIHAIILEHVFLDALLVLMLFLAVFAHLAIILILLLAQHAPPLVVHVLVHQPHAMLALPIIL